MQKENIVFEIIYNDIFNLTCKGYGDIIYKNINNFL